MSKIFSMKLCKAFSANSVTCMHVHFSFNFILFIYFFIRSHNIFINSQCYFCNKCSESLQKILPYILKNYIFHLIKLHSILLTYVLPLNIYIHGGIVRFKASSQAHFQKKNYAEEERKRRVHYYCLGGGGGTL